MIYPAKLKKGDTVGIVCPCSPVSQACLEACIRRLEEMGYRVKAADNITENIGGYMAGSAESRAMWLNRMFADPEVRAIFCVRGGDSGTRVAGLLDLDMIRRNPKIFVGYSDITTFHLLLNQGCGLVTFHGPMVSGMAAKNDEFSMQALLDCISGDGSYEFKNPQGFLLMTLKQGNARGEVIGGNLSVLAAAVGTSYDPDTRGKILFIEEVDEPVTKIEKWMWQLRNSGKISACSGILLGQFTNIVNRLNPGFDWLECVKDALYDFEGPVMYNLQSGHGEYNVTIPFGAVCAMDTADCSIRFDIPQRHIL